jgi:hypothetical protein
MPRLPTRAFPAARRRWLGGLLGTIVLASLAGGAAAQDSPAAAIVRRSVEATRRFADVPCRYDLESVIYIAPTAADSKYPEFAAIVRWLKSLRGSSTSIDASAVDRFFTRYSTVAVPASLPGDVSRLTRGHISAAVARSGDVTLIRSLLNPRPEEWQVQLRLLDRDIVFHSGIDVLWQGPRSTSSLSTLADLMYPLFTRPSAPADIEFLTEREGDGRAVATWLEADFVLRFEFERYCHSWLLRSGYVAVPETVAVTFVDYDLASGFPHPLRITQVNLQEHAKRCELRRHDLTNFAFGVDPADMRIEISKRTEFNDQLNPVPQRRMPPDVEKWVRVVK